MTYLAREECELYSQYLPEVLHRPWNLWKREVEGSEWRANGA